MKPKKFAQTDIDEVIIGHTNEAEFRKLLNEFMEALRDAVKIDIPYITKRREEIRIYEKDSTRQSCRASTLLHTPSRSAAMWAILTRFEAPKTRDLSMLQKLKLYDGKTLPGIRRTT